MSEYQNKKTFLPKHTLHNGQKKHLVSSKIKNTVP